MDESNAPVGRVGTNMSSAAAARVGLGHEREQLWRAFFGRTAQGDRDAFAALYDASSSLVYSLAFRILGNRADAEEVTLDVYLQVWREAGRFDAARGGVTSWLVTIGRSRALDRYRSHQTRQKREAGPVETDSPSGAPSPEKLTAMSQDRRVVAEAMASLAPEQRQVIDLAYFHGMSQSEMAEYLGLPLGTVKTRVRLGMMRLRELIGEWAG
jgi:RNA polymerase sigma-70 factor, ECF subfamily